MLTSVDQAYTIGGYVTFPHKKKLLSGRIAAISEKTGKPSIEFLCPEKRKMRREAKSPTVLSPATLADVYQARRSLNQELLAEQQDIPLDSNIVLHTDPRFLSYLPALASSSAIGFDIETKGYEGKQAALHPSTGDIRLIQVYLPDEDVVLFWDLGEIGDTSADLQNKNGFYKDCLPGVKELRETLANNQVKKYIHNAAFEQLWINTCFGITLFNVVDSMLQAQVFWAGMAKGMQAVGIDSPNSLKWVSFRLNLGVPDKQDQLWDYGFDIGNRQRNYAARDAKLTWQCGTILEKRSQTLGMVQCMDAEMRAIPAFADMRYKGFPISLEKLGEYLAKYREVVEQLKQDWEDEFPGVNPASSQQVGAAIVERYPIDISKINDKGELVNSIAYESLSPYFESYPILRTLASIGSVTKGLEYLEKLQANYRLNVYGIPCVYGDFRQLAAPASMGRSGCGGTAPYVQLQTPPKGSTEWTKLGLPKLRTVFEVPKGYKIISFDLSGSHAQIARSRSQDPSLMDALQRDIKVHFFTSAAILKLQGLSYSPEDIMAIKGDEDHLLFDRDTYDLICNTYEFSKTAFYSSLNGGGASRLQASFAALDPPVHLPLELCEIMSKGTKEAYPTMFKYMYSLPRQAARENHVIPVWFDGQGNPVHWGYYGGKEANKKRLVVPPSLPEGTKPRYVGQNQGKYCGYLPGRTRFYGKLRMPDGGVYWLQKEPDKKGEYVCALGDATAAMWQRIEKTGIADACGILTEKFHANPHWEAWIPSFLHDELMVVFKEGYADVIAPLVCDTVVSSMRKVVPDFSTEVKDPMKTVKQYWSK